MVSQKCMELEGEIKNFTKVWLSIMASLCYCYFIASKIPKGMLRFVFISPILYLFTILPLKFSSVLTTCLISFFITWLANFKLLLVTFDLGPLSSKSNPSMSLLQFLSFACLPIKQKYPKTKNLSKFHLLFPIKTLLFGGLLMGLNDHKQKLNPTILLGLYICLVYLLVDVVFGLCNILVTAVFGIELELPSNEPYFSTSLRYFWGRRWNLIVTHLLRNTVYIPVKSLMSKTVLGPHWASSVTGVMTSFLVSGLMHELVFYYVTRATPTWEVTCFFVLHGGCVVAEVSVMRLLGNKWRLHWVVSWLITMAFVVATATWLFFPPLLRHGADERSIKEFNNLVDCTLGKF